MLRRAPRNNADSILWACRFWEPLAALTFGINQIDTKNFGASVMSPTYCRSCSPPLCFCQFSFGIESRSVNPILRTELFKSRQIALVSFLVAGAGLGEASVVFVPALVVAIFGVSSSVASFMLLPAVIAMAIGSPSARRMLDHVGSRWVLMIGNAFVAMGMFVVALLGTQIAFFYLSAIFVGVGIRNFAWHSVAVCHA